MHDEVILVDANDNVLGTMEKMEAHVQGKLHRAFSVFIFNEAGQLLLQQRAFDKYHSGGKWTNTCCSHQRLNETNINAAQRRLMEEMGMECTLQPVFNFTYLAQMENGITEHEYDHVFFGVSNATPQPSPQEVAAYKYITMQELAAGLDANPHLYTQWLKICFNRVQHHFNQLIKQEYPA